MRRVKTLKGNNKDLTQFVSWDTIREKLTVSKRTLERYVEAGKLPAYKLDGKIIFNLSDIEGFLKRRGIGSGQRAPILVDSQEAADLQALAEALGKQLLAIKRLTPEEAELVANSRRLTQEETDAFFKNVERDKDGALVGWDSDENRPATEDPDEYRQK
jgi:excisionase family DNA binding protein